MHLTFPRSTFLGSSFLLPDTFLQCLVFLALQLVFLEDLVKMKNIV